LRLRAQPAREPFTKDQIIRLLKGDVSPNRIAKLARERGIDFSITSETETDLRSAGANDSLLAALRELVPKPPLQSAQIIVETLPDASVYLDDVFEGHASPEGRLVIDNPKPGNHTLRVSLVEKRNYEQKVTVMVGQLATISAVLADLPGIVVVPTGPSPIEVIKDKADQSIKKEQIDRTADRKNGTITLRYPSCIIITKYFLGRGNFHSLNNQKDLAKDGQANLELHITCGCPSGSAMLHMEIQGQRYPVGSDGESVLFPNGHNWSAPIYIPMSIWRSASEMELVLDDSH
jgi:hypothetical protein